jgi:hypothetical protein
MFPREAIEYGGIRISAEAIAELDGTRALMVVKRADLLRVRLDYGWHSNHPFLQIGFGGILVAIGLAPIPVIIHWLLFGGRLSTAWVWMLTMVLFGGWVVFDGLKRGFFLTLEGNNFRKKLCFDRRVGLAEIEKYLQEAETRFGYSFEPWTP